jgi:hypothetical protein
MTQYQTAQTHASTAIDWLVENLYYILRSEHYDIIAQAKEMEKEQIIDAWEDGQDSFSSRNAEIYYNETFKK